MDPIEKRLLIDELLQKAEANKNDERNKHLISLGLIDKSKSTRHMCNANAPKAVFDRSTGKCYIESVVAIDVTDDEYNEICKHFPYIPQLDNNIQTVNTINAVKLVNTDNVSKENMLDTVSKIFLVVGIISGLICLFSSNLSDLDRLGKNYCDFNPILFATGVIAILCAIANYAICQVFIQIALTLKGKTNLD